nr:hypothetical protein [Tanacetum cinerariifolium]
MYVVCNAPSQCTPLQPSLKAYVVPTGRVIVPTGSLKTDAFSVVYDSVKRMDNSRSYNLALFQKALAEFETQYGYAFTLEACRRILKRNTKMSLCNQQHNNEV